MLETAGLSTVELFALMYLYIIPMLSAGLAIFFVHHKNYGHTFVKLVIFIITAKFFHYVSIKLLMSVSRELMVLFNSFDFILSIRGETSLIRLMYMTFVYYGFFMISFFIYFCVRFASYFWINLRNKIRKDLTTGTAPWNCTSATERRT
jgi:hypothetical protein